MEQRRMLYDITYTLTIDDYYNYNKIVFSEMVHKRQKKQTILGVFSVLVAAFVLSTFLITSEFEILFIILDILLIIMGIYSIIYYPVIFKRKLKKEAIKNYKKYDLAYEKITLEFYETYVFQKIKGKDPRNIENLWSDFNQIFIYDDYIVLMLNGPNGVYIPSRILDEAYDAKLKGFIIHKALMVDMKILYEK